MKKNMGTTDRIVRTVIALLALYLYFSGTVVGEIGIILIVISSIFLLTSLISFCPLYTLAGLKTCKTSNS
jgi:hypothetical protein